MRLRLSLKGPARLMGADLEKILETGSIVIGRSPDAQWVIADPERLISKAHCRIDRNDKGFVVTDTSTNGLRINDQPVAREVLRQLADGDTLLLGDAVIAVEIRPAAEHPASAAATAPQASHRAVDPFMDGPFGFDDTSAQPVETTILTAPEAAPGDAKLQGLQDWWNPNSATDKLVVPVTGDILTSRADAQATQGSGGVASAPVRDGDIETIFKASEGVDSKTLARAIEMAVLVLSEQQRHIFEQRLRDILREEMARWQ